VKTAAEYADLAEEGVKYDQWQDAQVYATLALAAATLEAARLMGPTPEDQARLDALVDATIYCGEEWPGPCSH
jgi:hypothetical protein